MSQLCQSNVTLARQSQAMHAHQPTPDKDAIALLPAFERLNLDRIHLVSNEKQALHAREQLIQHPAWGFDTESKPTFKVGEVSDGPHVLQLATADAGWVIQLHDSACRKIAAELLAMPGIVKAGFGLGDDRKRIMHKLIYKKSDLFFQFFFYQLLI